MQEKLLSKSLFSKNKRKMQKNTLKPKLLDTDTKIILTYTI